MPQKVAQKDGLALLLKTVCHTSHKKTCCSGKIQNVLKIPKFARFWTKSTRFWPISDKDGPVLRVVTYLLSPDRVRRHHRHIYEVQNPKLLTQLRAFWSNIIFSRSEYVHTRTKRCFLKHRSITTVTRCTEEPGFPSFHGTLLASSLKVKRLPNASTG